MSALERALLSHLRLGSGAFVAHCRAAPGGCEARVHRTAIAISTAARLHGVDPWLLLAMALRESGANPGAVGRAGEQGLFQLHPRGRAGREAAQLCRIAPRNCGTHLVRAAVDLLARAIDRCEDVEHGLAAYNAGNCDSDAGLRYARAVLRLRVELIAVGEHAAAATTAEGAP